MGNIRSDAERTKVAAAEDKEWSLNSHLMSDHTKLAKG